ncbi:MAG: glycosyltransferase family 4 protein [Slackia sp.]|nr:glycosyltransferase family 4 protein [Slackia sp.]
MTRREHFIIFSAQFLPNIGGVEKYTDNLARELVRQGYRVTVATTDASAPAGRCTLDGGVEVVRLPCFPLIGGRMPVPRKNAEFKRLWNALAAQRYDGVLVNTRFYLHSLLGLRLAKQQGLTAAVCEHGSAYLTFGSPLVDRAVVAYEHGITARVKRYRPDFYAVSSKGLDWLSTFGIQGKGVLSNAIDADAFRASSSGRSFREDCVVPEDALLVSFVGRFIPEKGVDALIAAMDILEKRGVPAVLVMAGAGPLEERIREAHLSNIVVAGRLDAPDVAALMDESDLFCLPTRSEGFSTSLLEAAACATPAAITDVGGVAEMIPDDRFGIVLADARPETIADAIEAAACDRERLARQGACARDRVRDLYSWECTARAVIAAFENACR